MTDRWRKRNSESPARPGENDSVYTDADGIAWTFVPRQKVRREEEATHVTLLARSAFETRVITCLREEWETPSPDYAGLLSQSLPGGGSRSAPATTDPPE